MRKAKASYSDPYLAILDFRNTPTQGIVASPAQRLMSRRTLTLLPTTNKLLKPQVSNFSSKLRHEKKREERYYNVGTKDLPPLKKGGVVQVQPQSKDNRSVRRNRRHLRKSGMSFNISPPLESNQPSVDSSAIPGTPGSVPDTPPQCVTQNHEQRVTRSGRVIQQSGALKIMLWTDMF
ncbi:hypothetical protein SNE40_009902 [Patella caerulea]|uniref:Uncharacterized protein n=1 Tax=Patella caerulea TaxID=87958 RepID=A0AAN8PSB1_PATCE